MLVQLSIALALGGLLAASGTRTPRSGEATAGVSPVVASADTMRRHEQSEVAGMPEEAILVLVGTVLIGVAAAVRRAA